jgi:predicted ATP-grasp superfamily ATP-dependent carboligase
VISDRRVVVADEGRPNGRTALATVRALGRAGYAPVVTVAGGRTLASSSRWCAGVVPVPPDDDAGWSAAVRAAAREAMLVVPASDSAIANLGLPGAQLIDKRVVSERAGAVGLPMPQEQEYADHRALLEHAESLPYPVVVKPAARTSLHRAETVRVDDRQGIREVAVDQPLIVQPFIDGEVRSVSILVLEGRLVASLHQRYDRLWPPRCGAASASVTVDPDLELEDKVLQLVDGHEGVVQVQFIGDTVIDINPRMYASLSLAVRAGVNFPVLWCEAITDGVPNDIPVRARVGVNFRWTDADVRSLWADVRSGHMRLRDSLLALTPRRDTAHSIEDWRDPGPLAVRLAQLGGVQPSATGRAG